MKLSERISRIYSGMKQRCENPSHQGYKYYGGKGIKVVMTKDELKELWARDQAGKLKRPSIDRIDPNKNYEKSNCRFIEQSLNGQFSKGDKHPSSKLKPDDVRFIKKWFGKGLNSVSLSRMFGVCHTTILRIVWGDGWKNVK